MLYDVEGTGGGTAEDEDEDGALEALKAGGREDMQTTKNSILSRV